MLARKLVGAVAACALLAALCVGMSACSDPKKEALEAFTGTWDLTAMVLGGEEVESEQIDQLREIGLDVFVNLDEDGTAHLVLFGDVSEGTWSAQSATAGTITLDGEDIDMTIADGLLTFEQNDAALTFQKGDHKDLPDPASDEAAEAAADEAAGEGADASAEGASDASNAEASAAGESGAQADGASGEAEASGTASGAGADSQAAAEPAS